MKASDYIPALRYGHKIHPEDIAGMIGLPYVGEIFYVDPNAGNDATNGGKTQNKAFKTVKAAFAACTSGKHDVVIIAPTGGSGRTTEVVAIDWNKRFTHLIGSAGPTQFNPRAGMTFSSAVTSPCLTISNNGCIFKNITIATFADINVLVSLTGNENYFGGVHFAGIGHADAGDDIAARCIALSGAEENTFDGCTFGLDTVTRTGANYTIEFAAGCARNVFRGSFFTLFADADAPRHVGTDSGGSALDRFVLFEDCIFNDNSDVQAATVQTDVMQLDTLGDQGGPVIVKDCMNVSSTGWANDVTSIRMLGDASNDTLATRYCGGVNPGA